MEAGFLGRQVLVLLVVHIPSVPLQMSNLHFILFNLFTLQNDCYEHSKIPDRWYY